MAVSPPFPHRSPSFASASVGNGEGVASDIIHGWRASESKTKATGLVWKWLVVWL